MHALQLDKLFPVTNWVSISEVRYQSEACNQSAIAFTERIQEVHALSMVPGYSFMNGENWGISLVRAMKELGILNPDHPEVGKRTNKIFDEFDSEKLDDSTIAHFYEATSNAAAIASLPGRPYSHGAIESLLKSMVVQSWSAFELLSEQLLTEILKQHPHLFAEPILNRKYDFRSERTRLESYKRAFNADSGILAAVLDSEIKGHALLRHLLVHRNGYVDDKNKIEREREPKCTEWDSYQVGDRIFLDGVIVKRLLDRTTIKGFRLISACADWLKAQGI
jgi:hypothetical protein